MKDTWLHVQLAPTVDGLLLHVHEKSEPLPYQETVFPEEQLTTEVLEKLYVGVGVLTPEGIVLEINDAPLADAQVRREEVIGQPFAETPWWTPSPASQEQLRSAITRASLGETVRFETLIHPREGMDLYLEATITPHRDVDQRVSYLVYVGTDITARKRAEADIHALIDALPQLVWTSRPDGYVTYHNHRLINYLAMTPEQAEGAGWLAGVHPDDQQRVWEAWQTAIQTGRLYEVELRLQDGRSGTYCWFLTRGVPQRNAQGTILYWVGTCTDIEGQKRAEQQLKESRENLRVLAETVPQLVWVARPDGWHEYVNQHWRDYTGLTPEQVQSDKRAYLQFIHPEDRESNRAVVQRALDTGTMFEHEERLRNAQTGEYRWFLVRGMPMRDDTGQIIKWCGTCTDIEEQKRIEQALRESQERTSSLMNSTIIGVTIIEGEQIIDANDTFLRMTGYDRDDLHAGRLNWMRITPSEYLARTLEAHQELSSHQSMTPYEKEYLCRDGSRLPVLVGGAILEHHPHQAIAFVLDNSARKELEQRKDDFINMASHELRNPLAALKLQTAMLRRHLNKQGIHTAASALSTIETQLNKLTRLVEELLDVSKMQAGKLEYRRETVDLDVLLREIADAMQHLHPSHRILLQRAVHASLLGDRDRLGQVFSNLLSNAIKYSPDATTVEMELSATEETIRVRVTDHGLGIPQEQRDKIFERFYRVTGTQQKAIPGLGMGLYIVTEIVKHYEGTISVDSAVGKGSSFTVTLPKSRDA
ncbi:PAS domain S-box protein [Reticulibacter mediterranei]|uniref:PAS domain S-box protein n=1 Tax=Reticulibacter mediterranei TaxID=2778369 RepID=UPI0040330EDF